MASHILFSFVVSILLVSVQSQPDLEQLKKEYLPTAQAYCAARYGPNSQQFLTCYKHQNEINPEAHTPEEVFQACVPSANPTDAQKKALCDSFQPDADATKRDELLTCAVKLIMKLSSTPEDDIGKAKTNVDACTTTTTRKGPGRGPEPDVEALKKELLPVAQKYCTARFGPNGQAFLQCDSQQLPLHPENHLAIDLFKGCIPNENPTDADIQKYCKKVLDPTQSDAAVACFIKVIIQKNKEKGTDPNTDVANTVKNVNACA